MSSVTVISTYKPTNRHKELMTMGADQLAVLRAWLVEGVSPKDCAKRLQLGKSMFTDITLNTLKVRIQRYYNDKVLPNLMRSKVMDTPVSEEDLSDTLAKLDGYSALEALVILQEKRVLKLMSQEQKLPTLMESMRREIKQLQDLYKDLNYMQLELGIHNRKPRSLHVSVDGSGAAPLGTMITDDGKVISLDAVQVLKELLGEAYKDDEKLKKLAEAEEVEYTEA